ncbi:GNAT family N-acetyltransferase [soil metagenome]
MPRLLPPAIPPGSIGASAQPEVEVDGGVLLRPWIDDDADAAVAAFTDPDIQRWHFRRLDSVDEAHAWIAGHRAGWEAETSANWAIVAPGSVRPVGRIALTTLDLPGARGEVSYWLIAAARGQGLVTRSLLALTTWSFGELGLERIELKHSVDNPASCRVAERAGFAAEGTMRRALFHDDGWHDMHLHARLRVDLTV